MEKRYVQYGCGVIAPREWINYDASPTLRIQRFPLLGKLLRTKLNVIFPSNVLYGNIIQGLPEESNSCDGVYCSHTLEHLSLADFRSALRNTFVIMKPGAFFRAIVPDLEWAAREYLKEINKGNKNASIDFMGYMTMLGIPERPSGIKSRAASLFGNSHHLWMWDIHSFSAELESSGFTSIRPCSYRDCDDKMFDYVETDDRFINAVAIECRKP